MFEVKPYIQLLEAGQLVSSAGKSGATKPGDLRPISITSFMLKTLAIALDFFVRENLALGPIAKAQHTYVKDKPAKTALHEIISAIEKPLENKKYTLGIVIDIRGALNNVTTIAFMDAVVSTGVNNSASN